MTAPGSLDLVALSIESGRLCMPSFATLQGRAEMLLGRPIFTHELADPDIWLSLRIALVMPGYHEVVREGPATNLERRVGKGRVIRVG